MKRMILVFSMIFSLSFYAQNETNSGMKVPKIATVSADEMNVVYRGLANPITIYLPNNIPFMASAPGLVKDDKGKYILTPETGTEVIVSVVYQKNGNYVAEKHKFKILNIPPLNITIGGDFDYSLCSNCVYEFSKTELKDAILTLKTNRDFLYEIPAKILGMGFTFPDDIYIRISGNKMNEEVFSPINQLKKGEIVIVKFSLDTNTDVIINPLKIMIKE